MRFVAVAAEGPDATAPMGHAIEVRGNVNLSA
jgi:hypothetical protein